MKKIEVYIGYEGGNYSACIDLPGEVVVAAHDKLDAVKDELISAFAFSQNTSVEHIAEQYQFVYSYSISALLQSLGALLSRSALSKVTGINERLLGHYATGRVSPRPDREKRIIEGIHQIGRELLEV